ncbi:MAG: hypothetical protein GY859_36135, partial [Desulfobacterales bacterium]|nr:hypothetical protein [Desulfobacterales bacterium]
GPAGVRDASLEPALVNRLLNDMGADPDQLPLLQHALMRMWTMTAKTTAAAQDIRLTLKEYVAIGGLDKALSNHADEAYNDLKPDQQRIAEILFRALGERAEGKRDTRRPVRLSEPASVAGEPVEAVAEVADAFREKGRGFLTPPGPAPLGEATVVDISHETLIRQWERLKEWVADEAESAEIYHRLESTARLWKDDKAALWRTPDLDNALAWRDRRSPTPEWAARYGSDFDLAIQFLDKSEKQRQAEIKKKKEEQKAKLRRTRNRLLFALIGLFIALGLAFWGNWERGRAERQRGRAEQTEKARTRSLFESRLTHASLQAEVEDYAAAREILNQTRELDPDMPPDRRHARNLMAWYADLMGGVADKVYEGAGAQLQNIAISPDGATLAAV